MTFWCHEQVCRAHVVVRLGHAAKIGFGLVLLLALLLAGCGPPRGVYHTVQPGQTIYRIGQTYGVDADDVARLNGIADPTQLKVGQRLFIPGARSRRFVPATVAAGGHRQRVTTVRKRQPSSAASSTPSSSSRRTPAAPSASNKTSVRKNEGTKIPKGRFVWPVRGKLVKPFGQQGYGGRKGIEIEVRHGQTVVAAAAGHVTYSGDGIKGYGNLIILKHADDYFTVYGFNQANLVRAGSYVGKGDHIAVSGSPPGYRGSRLHFEIRHGKEALNPVSFLP